MDTFSTQSFASSSSAEALFQLRPEQIRLSKIAKSPTSRNSLIRLAESIKRYGILEPLAVRLATDAAGFPYYELLEGAERYRAACLAGVDKLPCRVLRADDKQCAEWETIEKLQQSKLHFLEKADAFALLMRDFRLTQEQIAQKLSLSQSAVANKLRLLRLSSAEREIILRHSLSERHARASLRLCDPAQRLAFLRDVAENRKTVAQAEAAIDQMLERESLCEPSSPPEGETYPRKFVLHDLRPLYNSIERTLTIFRKTGARAECVRNESPSGVEIVIRIPT